MKTYSFLTKQSNRIDVKGSNALSAVRKLLDTSFKNELTGAYLIYDKNGLDFTGFITTEEVMSEVKKRQK